MPKRSRQAVSSQSLLSADEAFQVVLKHFGDRQIAVQHLREFVLLGFKDGQRFEVDIDRYGLYFDVYQTPDGWHASVRMKPGGIGLTDFDAYRWAFSAERVNALCEPIAEDRAPPGARRGRKVQYDWPVFQAEFFGRLFFNDVGPHDEINIERTADDLMTWGLLHLGADNTPQRTAMQEKIKEWIEIWRRKPKTKAEELKNRKPKTKAKS
jgi:hypothetical protein